MPGYKCRGILHRCHDRFNRILYAGKSRNETDACLVRRFQSGKSFRTVSVQAEMAVYTAFPEHGKDFCRPVCRHTGPCNDRNSPILLPGISRTSCKSRDEHRNGKMHCLDIPFHNHSSDATYSKAICAVAPSPELLPSFVRCTLSM